jgi:hypothetical protein
MSNNKQSSVEWLVKELNQKIDYIPMRQWDEIKEVIEQAKAMHKEEIEQAYQKGYNDADFSYYDPEHYYNETYGGNNEN